MSGCKFYSSCIKSVCNLTLVCIKWHSVAVSHHKTMAWVKIRDEPKYLLFFISAFLCLFHVPVYCSCNTVVKVMCVHVLPKCNVLLPLPSLTVSIAGVAVQNLLVLSLFIPWEQWRITH